MDGGATLLRLFVTKKKDAYIGRKDFELVDDHVVKMDDHDSVASSSPLRAG